MENNHNISHEGILNLGGISIPCYVLQDGTRVLSGRGMQEALKMVDETEDGKQAAGTRLNRYLNQKSLNPFIYKDKKPDHFNPIICYKGTQKINGYEATILADICEAFLEARNSIELSTRQRIIADQCEILIRGFARVGITALVDEATGYQYERERDALQSILKAYINEELLKWQKLFPDMFYYEIFRLNNWDYTVKGIQKRPSVIGRWTNELIYKQLPKGILEELKNRTPKSSEGNYTARFFQSLTPDIGHPALTAQIYKVIGLMNISNNWNEFKSNFNRMVNRNNGQTEIDFDSVEKDL
ncbi:P63C domain-containing protein [Capnocytophaga sputigena]|uniref:P63C domain-containing protein n=1 Tax=Capnocytophaga sputigena TaxID=1019 RepID=UPI003C73E9FC